MRRFVCARCGQEFPINTGVEVEDRVVCERCAYNEMGLSDLAVAALQAGREANHAAGGRVDKAWGSTRFEVDLDVRIARIAIGRESEPEREDTTAEVIAEGGALVQCMMTIEEGETIEFTISNDGDVFRTRAKVMYVSTGEGPDHDGFQRLGLKFLDSPLPSSFIPPGALPLP